MHDKHFEVFSESGEHLSKFANSDTFKEQIEKKALESSFVRGGYIDLDGENAYKPNPSFITQFAKTPFKEILKEMDDLYTRKNSDYGNSFDKSLDEDGLLVAKIRLNDKLSRFSNLIKQENQVKDESMRDTLIDLANYAVMTLVWLDNKAEDN